VDELLDEQIRYYRSRAGEYDEWFLRRGRYDHGPERNAQWFGEVAEVARALESFRPSGRVLELACGTGWWTKRLARSADALTAVDASPEVIALNRERVKDPAVRYVGADLFAWRPDERYDLVFFSFWLSHVPPDRFEEFWEKVGSWLAPGGRVFFIDSLRSSRDTTKDQPLERPEGDCRQQRRLNDGQVFRIVKIYYEPERLRQRLAGLGWAVEVRATPEFFLYGFGTPGGPNRPTGR
jgi:demethylmenaquinone methyltransferase/2-methoxy-6-polyprenyl-1,4-benzoquinol methylase